MDPSQHASRLGFASEVDGRNLLASAEACRLASEMLMTEVRQHDAEFRRVMHRAQEVIAQAVDDVHAAHVE
jgi:hypothetical protein